MADPMKQFEAEALKLPKENRAELARVLLLSLDGAADEGDELAWAKEAEHRYQELKAGRAESIPSSEVFKEARARLE